MQVQISKAKTSCNTIISIFVSTPSMIVLFVSGWTALTFAIRVGHPLKTLDELIDAGADIMACDTNGWTSLMHASSKSEMHAMGYLLERDVDIHSTNFKYTNLNSESIFQMAYV